MKQIKYSLIILGFIWTTAALASEPLGLGLSKKYCLGDVCLGETDADHPELKIGEALKRSARYKRFPICSIAEASVSLRDVKFKNGTQGIIILHADPGNPSAQPEKYFRVSSITVKFDPFLSADAVKALEQKIASRYGMERASSYSFGVKDGKRTVGFTATPWESRLVVNGIDSSEYLAQPGCTQNLPNL